MEEGSEGFEGTGATSSALEASSSSKKPPVYNKVRGSKREAFNIAADDDLREQAMATYLKDKRSEGDTSGYNVKTWCDLHHAW